MLQPLAGVDGAGASRPSIVGRRMLGAVSSSFWSAYSTAEPCASLAPHRSVTARQAHLSDNELHRCAQFAVDVDAWAAHNIVE